jgi:uncharacterized membrane protein
VLLLLVVLLLVLLLVVLLGSLLLEAHKHDIPRTKHSARELPTSSHAPSIDRSVVIAAITAIVGRSVFTTMPVANLAAFLFVRLLERTKQNKTKQNKKKKKNKNKNKKGGTDRRSP